MYGRTVAIDTASNVSGSYTLMAAAIWFMDKDRRSRPIGLMRHAIGPTNSGGDG
jgi:hypothetical protein